VEREGGGGCSSGLTITRLKVNLTSARPPLCRIRWPCTRQVQLSKDALVALVGAEAVSRLWALPRLLGRSAGARLGQQRRDVTVAAYDTDIFVRRFSHDERPFVPFHCDSSQVCILIHTI
jgi:hypothetical protein